MSLGKRAARNIASVVLLAAAVYLATNVLIVYALGTKTPFTVVTSGSMRPTLKEGDLLIVRGVRSPSALKEGDIIVFRYKFSDKPVVHRIIRVIRTEHGEVYFQTKGDANPAPDAGYRTARDILGVVAVRIPKLGYVFWFFHTTEGRVLAVVLIAGIVVWSIIGEEREKERKAEHGEEAEATADLNK
ncbi:MAG: signal peptidase I [Thermoproteota archaeon]|nr:MAG: signal peptidase I [Candidatus Korarchaeota archaeon]RLG56088.1 MAG: signal peptidase I [Candidatus Korarchaeota archaeon]